MILRFLGLFQIIGLTAILALASPSYVGAAERNIENGIGKVLDLEVKAHSKLESDLQSMLKKLEGLSPLGDKASEFETDFALKESQLNDLEGDLAENHMRIEFLNAFYSATEQTSDLRNDSSKILLDLAEKQILSSLESSTENSLWKFEIYLSIAIRDCLEPNENFSEFLKKFILYSSLRDPKSPLQFCKSRKYIGG